jgi:hypothetical protein
MVSDDVFAPKRDEGTLADLRRNTFLCVTVENEGHSVQADRMAKRVFGMGNRARHYVGKSETHENFPIRRKNLYLRDGLCEIDARPSLIHRVRG